MKQSNNLSLSERLQGLAAFVPVFEQPGFTVGDWSKIEEPEPGVVSMPIFLLSEGADSFIKVAYDLGWVRGDFSWPEWMKTAEATRLHDDPAALASATPDQLARLLTVLIRQERFCEGSLAGAFESGLLVGIIRRAAALQSEPAGKAPPG